MNVKFKITAECRAENIDIKATAKDIEKEFEKLFSEYYGITTCVEVSELTYTEEGAQE